MDSALEAFAVTIRAPEADIDLARAALLIATVEHPGVPVEQYLDALDALADRSGCVAARDPLRRLHRLREFVFEEEGFGGNVDDYSDPRNSCLNDVLDRRLGIPITLSLVLIEVGRRVGLSIDGVGLPGHFIVSAHVGEDRILLDTFNGGAMLTHEGCVDVVTRAIGRRVDLVDDHFAPVAKRQLLSRMLNNLKAVYWRHEQWEKALAVIDLRLAVDERSREDLRDRGTILIHTGERRRGVADWERYLTRYPQAPDAEEMRGRLRRVRQTLAALN